MNALLSFIFAIYLTALSIFHLSFALILIASRSICFHNRVRFLWLWSCLLWSFVGCRRCRGRSFCLAVRAGRCRCGCLMCRCALISCICLSCGALCCRRCFFLPPWSLPPFVCWHPVIITMDRTAANIITSLNFFIKSSFSCAVSNVSAKIVISFRIPIFYLDLFSFNRYEIYKKV